MFRRDAEAEKLSFLGVGGGKCITRGLQSGWISGCTDALKLNVWFFDVLIKKKTWQEGGQNSSRRLHGAALSPPIRACYMWLTSAAACGCINIGWRAKARRGNRRSRCFKEAGRSVSGINSLVPLHSRRLCKCDSAAAFEKRKEKKKKGPPSR